MMAEDKVDKKTDIQTAELSPGKFENILNFRDVGKTINRFLGEKLVSTSTSIKRAGAKKTGA